VVRRRRIDGRLFDCDCDLKGLLVQFDQEVSLAHPVVIIHQNPRNLASDAGGDEGDVTVDVGVIRRNRVEGCAPSAAETAEPLPSPARGASVGFDSLLRSFMSAGILRYLPCPPSAELGCALASFLCGRGKGAYRGPTSIL
jgi:hypothetical protein